MLFLTRAASNAVAIFVAAALVCTSAPGLASELQTPTIATTTFNALMLPSVPTIAAPPVPTVVFAPSQEILQPVPTVIEQTSTIAADRPQLQPRFASLSDAVAAQDAGAIDRELTCLAAGVYFESNGEPLAGQLAVAETIMNRTRSGRFAKSVCGVLTQRGQFSFVRGGSVPTAEGRTGWKTAVAVAKVAMRELWESPASSALYFHARRVSPSWRATRVAALGNHVFYR